MTILGSYARFIRWIRPIKILQEVQKNDAVGDIIGIYKECNCLEFTEDIDIDDEDVREFIKTYFKNYRAVLGFIRKIMER